MKNHWLSILHLWLVDDGEQHWFSANSEDNARQMYYDSYGGEEWLPCEIEEILVERVDDEEMLSVRLDEGSGPEVTKTAKEWADDGKGMVASTVY